VAAYQQYSLHTNATYLFDLHEYIVFGGQLFLAPIGQVEGTVRGLVSNNFGVSKWKYIVGEWSLATTDCAQYLNGAFGGFSPNYYKRQHESRSSFTCNNINQERDGQQVGYDTCSVILPTGLPNTTTAPSYGYCAIGNDQAGFKAYSENMCNLYKTYTNSITSNHLNIGYSFWTYQTGSLVNDPPRRIQQWDLSWGLEKGFIPRAGVGC